ncbi:hypothetical protein C0989_003888 [Termitomyces sp. Mn162]|nr:hypothetical protein C0989_003888 [Termitomyces sp. Mn162]
MSVSLNPSTSLGFKRPLTQLVKRVLTITNHNSLPIAFKVKTTAPKLYCVRPNSGRIDSGESLDVSVMLQPLKEDPPSNVKCKDKFLIQSTLITPAREAMNAADIWSSPDTSDEGKVHQHKLRVAFLPAEGQALEEEDEPQPHLFDNARQHIVTNGHAQRIPDFVEPPPQPQEVQRPITPVDFSVAREDSHELAHDIPIVQVSSANDPLYESTTLPPVFQSAAVDSDLEYAPDPAPIPQPIVSPELISIPVPIQEPIPVPAPVPAPASVQDSYNEELAAKYEMALHEIERLRAIVANYEESPIPEIRRRRPALSDDGMSVAETDVQTAFADEGQYHQQEGVPLQVVVIIALGVFITTYLFF